MKKLLIGLLLLLGSFSAFSQVNVDINLGQGAWICSAEGMKDYPTIARGTTKTEAKHYAKQACADYEGSDFFCRVETCVKDTNADNININIDFIVERNGSNININLTNGSAGHVCVSEAWSKSYIAKAPTKLEAEVLSRQTCIADGNSGMFCDVEECEALSSSASSENGDISIEGAIRGLGGLIRRN